MYNIYIVNKNIWINYKYTPLTPLYNEPNAETSMNPCRRFNEPNCSMNLINTPHPVTLTIFCETWLKPYL